MIIGIDTRFWNQTGVGRYLKNLCKNLHEIDNKNGYILFIQSEDREDIEKIITNKNWKIVIVDIPWHTLAEQIQFPKVLDSYSCDVVHFPYFSVPVRYKGKFIVTIHDLIIHHFSTGKASTLPYPAYFLKRQAYKYIIQKAAEKADRIIAVSNATKNEIIDKLHIDHTKISVSYEGVDPALAVGKSKASPEKFLLYVGNMYPHKNIDRLIDAIARLNLKGTDLKLYCVGKSDFFQKRYKDLVLQKKLQNTIIFLENIDDKNLADLYTNAVATIMPSLMEGFGLPLLEAMSAECITIASDIPSLKEVCLDIPIYVDPYSSESIAEGIEKALLLDSDEKKNLQKKGRARSELFSWRKMAEETLSVYENSYSL